MTKENKQLLSLNPNAAPKSGGLLFPYKNGKINLGKQVFWGHHRSGWKYAISMFKLLNHPRGIKFNGFLDGVFSLQKRVMVEPFVGVFHNVPYHNNRGLVEYSPKYKGNSLSAIFSSRPWKDSVRHCRGIWTFSEYVAKFIRQATKVTVSSLRHPTSFSALEFSFDDFDGNKNKQLLFIGHWMRNYEDFFKLSSRGYTKRLLMSGCHDSDLRMVNDCTRRYGESIAVGDRIPNDEYDKLLHKNICFISLFDANVNNVVIECMVRKTPLLVNRLPSIVEYLGEDYPFYYKDLEEAAHKLSSLDLIYRTHEYLSQLPQRKFLSGREFCESLRNSSVYNNL